MERFIINGGNKLSGTLDVSTSKNATLPIIAGSIMSDNVYINNTSNFSDINTMFEILRKLGSKVCKQDKTVCIDNTNISNYELPIELTKEVRSSIFMLGPLLTRMKKAKVAHPGGCNIGNRPIDLHLKGLEALGVKIKEEHGFIVCDGSNMKSNIVHLDFPSVGATENIMMAAVKLKGTTRIINSAREPEIIDLQNFLNKMGAKIVGAGTSEIIIEGVEKLNAVEYTPIGDRIIAGTYLIATAITGGNVELCNANYEYLYHLITKLECIGCKITNSNDKIYLQSDGNYKSFGKIETHPYPGFATDLQPQAMSLSTICKGTTIISENLFETRFKHVAELQKLGANITVKDRTAVIKGVKELFGTEVTCTDLRAGAALIIAGLKANGTTIINEIQHIDRGYEQIENDLKKLNADIVRSII